MSHESENRLPAVIPAVLFIAALASSPLLVDPGRVATAMGVVALLSCGLRTPSRRRLILPALALALGFWRGVTHQRDERVLQTRLASLEAGRFVTIEAEITSGWIPLDRDSRVLRLERARVTQDATSFTIDQEISIYARFARNEAETRRARLIHAEGFLRKNERGKLSMSVKSERLIGYSGEVSALRPPQWNRVICASLDRASAGDETLLEASRFVKALALGHNESLSAELRRSYREGGTYHLLVFSGMQIALAAAALLFLLRWLRRPRIADWLLLLLAFLAPPFAGNEPSVGRASLMIGLYAVTRLLHRPTHFANLIFVSAVVRLLAHPEELTDGGFILTYTATAGLILVGQALASLFEPRRRLLRGFARGVGAELALLPVTQWLFHRVIAGSSVITFLAAPLVAAMLGVSIAFCLAAAFFQPALLPLARIILLLDSWCRVLNGLVTTFGLTTVLPSPSAALVVAVYGAALLILLVASKKLRALAALPLVVPLTLTLVMLTTADVSPRIEMLDVGQGDAVLLRSGKTAVLVDGGGRNEDDTFGERVLVPLLLQRNVRELAAVVLTHPHPDHCGGLTAVLRELEVGELWLSGRQWREGCSADLAELARRRGIAIRIAERNPKLVHPGIVGRVLTPRLRFKRAAVNNGSIVLDVMMEKRRLLLTGDIERDGERLLVDDYPDLRADIVKIAHHGSRTSSGDTFLDVVRPRIALISCGRANLYGHPAPEVLFRLTQRGIQTRRTDRSGSLLLLLGQLARVDTSRTAD